MVGKRRKKKVNRTSPIIIMDKQHYKELSPLLKIKVIINKYIYISSEYCYKNSNI